jgi:hypothetical protein
MVRAYAKRSRRIPSRRMPGWDRRAELPTSAANTERRTPGPRTPRPRRSGGAHRGGWGRRVPADLRRQRAHVAARAVGSAAPNRRAGHGMFGRISRERTSRPTRLSRRELLSSHPSLAFALHTFRLSFCPEYPTYPECSERESGRSRTCGASVACVVAVRPGGCRGGRGGRRGPDAAGKTPRGPPRRSPRRGAWRTPRGRRPGARRRGGRGGAHVAGRMRRGGAGRGRGRPSAGRGRGRWRVRGVRAGTSSGRGRRLAGRGCRRRCGPSWPRRPSGRR